MINRKYEKPKPHMISQSDAPAPEEVVVCKKIDTSSVTSYLSSSTGKSCLTGGTRVNVTPEKRITKKHKYIKPTALPTFIPGNKILLKEDNYDNPETTDTSLSGKDDMSHTSKDDFTEKRNDKTNYRSWWIVQGGNIKIKEVNESVDNSETSDNLGDDSIIKTTKNIEALIQRLMTMNFKYHVTHSVINIFPLCRVKW